MGKIEDALMKTRQLGRSTGSQPAGRSGFNAKAKGPVNVHGQLPFGSTFDELHKQARKIELDNYTLEQNRVTSDAQSLTVRSAYKMLRTRLLQRMRANNWNSLAITSARSQAGKTLTAINTAISLAHEPTQRVVLVDLDLRRPSISKYMGLSVQYGLSDHLIRGVPIEKVALKTEIDRLLIIPNMEPQESSSELISSPQMISLVERLTDESAGCMVIFDLPPLLDADDFLAFSPHIDALLFIIADCETRRADLQQARDILEDLNVVGAVLNKSDDESPSYY